MTTRTQRTIVAAIREVLHAAGRPMTVDEIYRAVADQGLYAFKAAAPAHVVRTALRRHTAGVTTRGAAEVRYFEAGADGRYTLRTADGP